MHFGTHGTQEWLPGKERGLAVSDYPLLAVGDVPVVYPYIVDNIGEALQAKRRGRAVTVTHQTPPFAPAGLHDTTVRIHDLLHAWLAQFEGAVRDRLKADLLGAVKKERIDKDLGWDDKRIAADFPAFADALHTHLHELAQTAQPLGLHTFGKAPREEHRIGTVLLMLGKPYWELAARHAGTKEDNPLHANSREIAARLVKQGVPEAAARAASETRIFSSESGRYGTGLDDAALATDTWKGKAEGDRKLARLYLERMQFGYGTDESAWGSKGIAGAEGKATGLNLYAEHLKGTEGAVLSRTSNLYGMLTTDDPFQYLGGIALAVRQLDGKAPELYIANLRESGAGKVEGADAFLAKELATRNFHPGYIKGLMAEGYAGTLQVLDSMNNFWGWNAVAREIVRDDQWQEFVDVYVRDKHKLGLKQWFEAKNPHALAQTIERMLEAARQGYWQADPATVRELKERYRDLARRHDVKTDNRAFDEFVAPGYGIQAPALPEPAAAAAAAPPPPPQISGMKLERVAPPSPAAPPFAFLGLALLALTMTGGVLRTATHPANRITRFQP